MEAVAWFNNEEHSDNPQCACPVLAAYGKVLNDQLSNQERRRLTAFVPKLVDTRSTHAIELKRAYYLADQSVRVIAPMVLTWAATSPALKNHARRLKRLAPLVDDKTLQKGTLAAIAAAETARIDSPINALYYSLLLAYRSAASAFRAGYLNNKGKASDYRRAAKTARECANLAASSATEAANAATDRTKVIAKILEVF